MRLRFSKVFFDVVSRAVMLVLEVSGPEPDWASKN
jgi:hypothetical protein